VPPKSSDTENRPLVTGTANRVTKGPIWLPLVAAL
jgi:hypothetical protein